MTVAERVKDFGWYHTMDLGDGVVTPGWFDMRPYIGEYGIPDRLDGKRVLEVGTWDGFWAFELERRGAEVVALDLDDERALDWPPRRRPATFSDEPRGQGFRLAKEILDSKVERVVRSIYHATPEELGTFDLVFCGSVLIHLRDQFLALERMAGLSSGQLILAEEYDRLSSLVPWAVSRFRANRPKDVVFWLPSRKTWKRMVWTAGFDRVEEHGRFVMRAGKGEKEFAVRHQVLHGHKQ
ncbi:MAG: methyltransferase domain-containing protein [Solirubrobacterales bacterium]|nr:methyltransferase domain-containing protein [Solirubrobacterales bacterium]